MIETSPTVFNSLLFLLGLIVGSFVGMLTWRIVRSEGFGGRSRCDSCGHTISWYHNIPLLSYALLQGQCAYCKKRIGKRYPAIELITAFGFVATAYLWQNASGTVVGLYREGLGAFSFLFALAVLVLFLSLLVTDLETFLLPDWLVVALGALVAIALLYISPSLLLTHALWGLCSFVFFLTIFLVTRGRGMGFGDVKLSFVLGMMLGFPNFVVWLFLSFVIGAFVGIALLLSGRVKFRQAIPFGPYLLISAYFTMFMGDNVLGWYISLL